MSTQTHDIPLAEFTPTNAARQAVSAAETIVWQANKGSTRGVQPVARPG